MQQAAIASNPDCGSSHYNLAVGYLGQKKYEEAEKELHEAISCSPSLAEAYVQLGGIRLQRGDLEGCLDYNQRAVKARAGFAEGWGNIGFVQMQLGNIVRWNLKFLQAYATLANAYLAKGRIDESIETNLKVISMEPNFPVVYNNLAIAYLEKGEIELAIENADKALELGYDVAPQILEELNTHR
jgi:tetratricopeptide (TPR) repeat protein